MIDNDHIPTCDDLAEKISSILRGPVKFDPLVVKDNLAIYAVRVEAENLDRVTDLDLMLFQFNYHRDGNFLVYAQELCENRPLVPERPPIPCVDVNVLEGADPATVLMEVAKQVKTRMKLRGVSFPCQIRRLPKFMHGLVETETPNADNK